MLVLVRSFSYIPHTDHSEDVLKHFTCWIGENLLLHSYTPHASFSEMFVLHTVITIVLVRSFSYIPHIDHSVDVLKHFACWIGENLLLHCGAHLVLELVRTCVYLIL